MTQRALSRGLKDAYDTLLLYSCTGKALPPEAVQPLLKAMLTARFMAEELEEELDIAERLLRKRDAKLSNGDNVIRLPTKPRVVVNPGPGGGDAA